MIGFRGSHYAKDIILFSGIPTVTWKKFWGNRLGVKVDHATLNR